MWRILKNKNLINLKKLKWNKDVYVFFFLKKFLIYFQTNYSKIGKIEKIEINKIKDIFQLKTKENCYWTQLYLPSLLYIIFTNRK